MAFRPRILVLQAPGESAARVLDACRTQFEFVEVDGVREALALIASGAVECESLVDCVLGLDEFDEGLARYMRRQALKVVFAP